MSEKKGETAAPVHHGTIEPDASADGADWIRRAKPKEAKPPQEGLDTEEDA